MRVTQGLDRYVCDAPHTRCDQTCRGVQLTEVGVCVADEALLQVLVILLREGQELERTSALIYCQ